MTKKYTFGFTGSDNDMLFRGIEVELNTSMNSEQCINKLFQSIEQIIDIKGKQMIVYLAGGIPFISGTLGSYYLWSDYT